MRPHDIYARFVAAGILLRRRPGDNRCRLVVYVALNVVNGNCYIGATRNKFGDRRRSHIDAASKGKRGSPAFYSALRKYGAKNFAWFILVSAASIEELFKQEVELIAKLNPEYNITIGGQGVLGAPRTLEWRTNQSRALMGRVSPKAWSGKHHSQETKNKISRSKKGQRPPASLVALKKWRAIAIETFVKKHSYPIVCVDDGLHFINIRAASEYYKLNLSDSELSNSHPKIRCGARVGGLLFQYAENHQ